MSGCTKVTREQVEAIIAVAFRRLMETPNRKRNGRDSRWEESRHAHDDAKSMMALGRIAFAYEKALESLARIAGVESDDYQRLGGPGARKKLESQAWARTPKGERTEDETGARHIFMAGDWQKVSEMTTADLGSIPQPGSFGRKR